MNFRFSYSLFLFLICLIGYSQDIIVKKDSSRIEVKLLELKQTEIKYKLFSYQDGPDIIISKSDIAYVVYPNGTKEVFNKATSDTPVSIEYSKPIVWQGDTVTSKKEQSKLRDYIKFNVQLGAVINSLSSNYSRRGAPASHTSSEDYTASSNKYVYNFNVGFNFLLGKSLYIKHLIGINYLRSTGEYNYHYSQGGYTSYYQDFHYVSKIDFINIVTGLHFKIIKGFYIEPLVSFNLIAHSDVKRTGTSTTKYISAGPTPMVYKEEIEYSSNKKVDAERSGINSTISLCPRISYEFNKKSKH